MRRSVSTLVRTAVAKLNGFHLLQQTSLFRGIDERIELLHLGLVLARVCSMSSIHFATSLSLFANKPLCIFRPEKSRSF